MFFSGALLGRLLVGFELIEVGWGQEVLIREIRNEVEAAIIKLRSQFRVHHCELPVVAVILHFNESHMILLPVLSASGRFTLATGKIGWWVILKRGLRRRALHNDL
jgi:hypothetical protein